MGNFNSSFNPQNEKEFDRFAGLENVGNTCYMNSVLQQISMMPRMQLLVLNEFKDREEEKTESGLLLNNLYGILNTLSQNEICAPDGFSPRLGFEQGRMHDSHQFFTTLFDRICESKEVMDTEVDRTIRDELELGVMMQRTLDCDHNKNAQVGVDPQHIFLTDETTFCLSLPSKRTIRHSLDEFLEQEDFERRKCAECKKKFSGTQKRLFTKLPKTLCLHVKRIPLYDSCIIDEEISLKTDFPLLDAFKPTQSSDFGISMQELTNTPSKRAENMTITSSLAKYRWFNLKIKARQNIFLMSNTVNFTFIDLPRHLHETFSVQTDGYSLSEDTSFGSKTVCTQVNRENYEFCIRIRTASRLVPQSRLIMHQDGISVLDTPITCRGPLEDTQGYKLAGVVIHKGTYVGGHNYSYIKSRHSETEEWYKFNDKDVKPVEEILVHEEARKYAVMAFYEQIEYQEDDSDEDQEEEYDDVDKDEWLYRCLGFLNVFGIKPPVS